LPAHWSPPLDGTQRDRAVEAVLAIAHALSASKRQGSTVRGGAHMVNTNTSAAAYAHDHGARLVAGGL